MKPKNNNPNPSQTYSERYIERTQIQQERDQEQKNFSLLMGTQAYQRVYGPGASDNLDDYQQPHYDPYYDPRDLYYPRSSRNQ